MFKRVAGLWPLICGKDIISYNEHFLLHLIISFPLRHPSFADEFGAAAFSAPLVHASSPAHRSWRNDHPQQQLLLGQASAEAAEAAPEPHTAASGLVSRSGRRSRSHHGHVGVDDAIAVIVAIGGGGREPGPVVRRREREQRIPLAQVPLRPLGRDRQRYAQEELSETRAGRRRRQWVRESSSYE